jgi:hypothetical protein
MRKDWCAEAVIATRYRLQPEQQILTSRSPSFVFL